MKVVQADIGNSGELHRLYIEYSKDTKKPIPTPDIWLLKFRDPTFYCLLAKHGKKSVGFIMGNFQPYFERPMSNVDVLFVRRGFRKFKFIRSFTEGLIDFLGTMKIQAIVYNRTKHKEKSLG